MLEFIRMFTQELENVGGEEELQKVLIAKYKVRKA